MEIPLYYRLVKAEVDILQIIKKMGNVFMSCYFSVLILAICKQCRLVPASEATSSPSETREDIPPQIEKEKGDVCTSFAFSSSIAKEVVPYEVQQEEGEVLSVFETDESDLVIYYIFFFIITIIDRIWN